MGSLPGGRFRRVLESSGALICGGGGEVERLGWPGVLLYVLGPWVGFWGLEHCGRGFWGLGGFGVLGWVPHVSPVGSFERSSPVGRQLKESLLLAG